MAIRASISFIISFLLGFVAKDEILLEISTDKVDSEIPSPFEGNLIEVLFKKNDTVEVGTVIALIGEEGETDSGGSLESAKIDQESQSDDSPSDASKQVFDTPDSDKDVEIKRPLTKKTSKFYSPLVRKMAKEEGISLSELESISGSGIKGRVNKRNLLRYIEDKNKGSSPYLEKNSDKADKNPLKGGFKETRKMDHVRKVIAKHMVNSLKTSPHVYSSVEVDMTDIGVLMFQQKILWQALYLYENLVAF